MGRYCFLLSFDLSNNIGKFQGPHMDSNFPKPNRKGEEKGWWDPHESS